MNVKASGGSPKILPQMYKTAPMSTIAQAEQQDRFLQLGELNELVTFLSSGTKRLEVADLIRRNANTLVAKAADKIFAGGSGISYLERPQAAFLLEKTTQSDQQLVGDTQVNFLDGFKLAFNSGQASPTGFKPINVIRYGPGRMKKSLRDLDWFLRYLTYAIIAGDPNILSVNIRGLRELINNVCSSPATIVALREMKKTALTFFINDIDARKLVEDYFNIIISEFGSPSLTDKIKKSFSNDVQGLRLPQIYSKAGIAKQRFTMKTSLSLNEKNTVIDACYRQIFERDIHKAYSLSLSNLESQVRNGQSSIKEFIRALGKSYLYKKDFFVPFVNSRVLELAFRHFLGRGISSLREFQRYFSILSSCGFNSLIDSIINSQEYADYFGEETVPYIRNLGEEPQECCNWGPKIDLMNYSAPFRKIPQFITLFSDYSQTLPDQHPYGIGNDPLSIQFGAIFPNNIVNLRKRSAPFGKDTRRILIRRGPGIYNQISSPSARSQNAGSLGPKIFRLDLAEEKDPTLVSIDSIIKTSYLRVFGRVIYEQESIIFKKIEKRLRDNQITVRDFIRELAKSSVFRSLYWYPFYVCKAIEYIHNRLLGRPTYGRQEINKYFDIVYQKGYYEFIDSIIDSLEYSETFNNNIVPYERYVTALSLSSKVLRPNLNKLRLNRLTNLKTQLKFVNFGKVREVRSKNNIRRRILQGVTFKRDELVVFQYKEDSSKTELEQILRAAYRQIFERDINSFSLSFELMSLREAFIARDITVRQLIQKLGLSKLYAKEFYHNYPNTKVIELGTKHFLGRAPKNQAEIRFYNQVLASQGLLCFISILTNSKEYECIFGESTVPYRRFPTLPAANFPNTEKLYSNLTRRIDNIIVPSFDSVKGNQ